eukprot:4614258-Amphidinium_carterae.1
MEFKDKDYIISKKELKKGAPDRRQKNIWHMKVISPGNPLQQQERQAQAPLEQRKEPQRQHIVMSHQQSCYVQLPLASGIAHQCSVQDITDYHFAMFR